MDALCKNAEAIETYGPLMVIQWIQIAMSLSTIIALLVLFRNFNKNKLILHANFKMVLTVIGVLYCIHATTIVVKKLNSRYQYYTMDSDCEFVQIRWKCLLLSAPVTFSVFGCSICHVILFLERACATFYSNRYEKVPRKYTILVISSAGVFLAGWIFYIFCNEDLTTYSDYCQTTTERSRMKMLISFYVQLAVDVCCTAGDFYLFLLSRKRLNQRFSALNQRQKSQFYELSRTFQLRENKLTTSVVFPLSAVYSTLFGLFLVVSGTFRNLFDLKTERLQAITALEGAHIFVCTYELITVVMMLILHNKFYKHQNSRVHPVELKQEADLYFKMFDMQMND